MKSIDEVRTRIQELEKLYAKETEKDDYIKAFSLNQQIFALKWVIAEVQNENNADS